jgi:class 3 adenylate cyclase/alpha-beta hydrolase superfamily lysophospholipase
VQRPETRYAKSGAVNIAYQVVGEGPPDLVLVPGFVSNVDLAWEEPAYARAYERLSSFSRLLLLDKRGTGCSDRVRDLPALETRMDDVRAVMDAAGSTRAVVFGISEGGAMSLLFAATYPDRTLALVVYGGYAKGSWTPDYPWGPTPDEARAAIEVLERRWGTREYAAERLGAGLAPSVAEDEDVIAQQAAFMRLSASPTAAAALYRMNREVDVRDVLPAIRVPTLVLHRTGDGPEAGRFIAERIPGARYVELPGDDHHPWFGTSDELIDEVERFVTGLGAEEEPDTVLATILFTDIVGSTAKAAELGDHRWRELLERHHALVRAELARFRGRELDTAGDGFFASFDGPARAVRCACAITESVRALGLELRAGLHTGECERLDRKVGGIAVHIGARVAAQAGPGEVLVSSTVRDLVAGSGLVFEERGSTELKGVPGEWRLYAVA